jgi:hypothetical protein
MIITGKTLQMVLDMPENGAFIVCHSHPLAKYIERMVRDVRGKEVASRTKVVIVRNYGDANHKLMGAAMPVLLDHAFYENVSDETAMIVHDLAKMTNGMFKDPKYFNAIKPKERRAEDILKGILYHHITPGSKDRGAEKDLKELKAAAFREGQQGRAFTNTETLMFIMGWQGGTIEQVASALHVSPRHILNADNKDMGELARAAQEVRRLRDAT